MNPINIAIFISIWGITSITAYGLKYGFKNKNKIEIMSVRKIEKKYKRINDADKDSIF